MLTKTQKTQNFRQIAPQTRNSPKFPIKKEKRKKNPDSRCRNDSSRWPLDMVCVSSVFFPPLDCTWSTYQESRCRTDTSLWPFDMECVSYFSTIGCKQGPVVFLDKSCRFFNPKIAIFWGKCCFLVQVWLILDIFLGKNLQNFSVTKLGKKIKNQNPS